ncbi:glycosyltransferase [Svornostia abyssi]|uniref:Glycosyltransferase n=1 Tax=Svornostia abyssi TaxID=2898438 RepID=A0ABY5PEB2_9ACTN|nr:glycosyltransferase [Parviterribacteraceae bacterium J379]
MRAQVPLTAIVPTVGREGMLADALASIAACDPRPAELLVVDQSGRGAGELAADGLDITVRVLAMAQHGISVALNAALREATHDRVLVTHDDCRVAQDWAGVAAELLHEDPDALWTGRVLPDVEPGRDPSLVPSTIDDPEPAVYAGVARVDVLYPANMAVGRAAVLDLGGFDERFTTAAEDNDLCLRWLMAGRTIRYEPRLTVWHRDWRSPQDLRALYRRYQLAQGALLAKHLRLGHAAGRRLALDTLVWSVRGTAHRWAHGRRIDETTASLTHIPLGLARNWRAMAPVRDD